MASDMTEYEQMRAQLHEELCRQTATLVHIRRKICRLRACRRRGICSGQMAPSPHQAGQVEAQRMLGLSGLACAQLPLCTANLDPRFYEAFKRAKEELERDMTPSPEIRWRAIFSAVSRRRRRPLTSAANHPTSGSDPGGAHP